MKLQRAPHINECSFELEGTSQGAYQVVGTPFLILKDRQEGYWFIFSEKFRVYEWLERHTFNRYMPNAHKFPTRSQALDSLEMALTDDPL